MGVWRIPSMMGQWDKLCKQSQKGTFHRRTVFLTAFGARPDIPWKERARLPLPSSTHWQRSGFTSDLGLWFGLSFVFSSSRNSDEKHRPGDTISGVLEAPTHPSCLSLQPNASKRRWLKKGVGGWETKDWPKSTGCSSPFHLFLACLAVTVPCLKLPVAKGQGKWTRSWLPLSASPRVLCPQVPPQIPSTGGWHERDIICSRRNPCRSWWRT